jgi:hypothetical protein
LIAETQKERRANHEERLENQIWVGIKEQIISPKKTWEKFLFKTGFRPLIIKGMPNTQKFLFQISLSNFSLND